MLILRVDDRLIHGQVVAGWARPLGVDSLILASDKLSTDEWACNAYRLAIPEGVKFFCLSIKDCVAMVTNGKEKRRTMIVVERIFDAYELVSGGLKVREIVIGGMSYAPGTRSIAPYIYLSGEEIEYAVRLFDLGIKLVGKQLPNSPPIDVAKNLAGVKC